MTATNSGASLILNITGAQSLALRRGEKTSVIAKPGRRYRVTRQGDEAAAQDVVASQQGQDLLLSYADGAQVVLTNFYDACRAEQCAVDMPGAKGTGISGGYVITGDSPVGVSLADGSRLVYAFGDSASLFTLTQGADLASGFAHQDNVSTYIPPGHASALWNALQTGIGVAGVAAVAYFGAKTTPVPTIINGSVVAGPVLAGHGLTVAAYKADGSALTSAAVKTDGTFSLNLGNDYRGPVLVKVSDADNNPDYFDEATGAPKDLTTDLRAIAVIPAAGSYNLSVNVLTELAVRKLGLTSGDKGSSNVNFTALSQAQISDANREVASAVGLTQDLVLGTAPVAIVTDAGASNAKANDYGRLLAALSGAESGSDTNTVLNNLVGVLNSTRTQAKEEFLQRVLEGAAKINLVEAVSNITNQKSTAITIDAVAQDNRISPAEMIDGVQVQGKAAAGATVIITWFDASGAVQTTGTRTVTADAQGRWSASFTSAEMPALGATTLKATVGSDATTRSVFLDEPSAPAITLTQTTGNVAGLTGNGRIEVSNLLSGAGWDYSTDGGISWTAGSGSGFTVTGDGAKNVLVRQNIGGHYSPSSNQLSFTFDATAPDAPSFFLDTDSGAGSGDGITNVGTVTVAGIETGAIWEYSTDGGSKWNSGSGSSFTLAEGMYASGAVRVRQTDPAGNVSDVVSNTNALNIDATAPTVTISSNATSLRLGVTASLTFTLSEASSDFTQGDITVVGGTLSNFAGSGTSYTATFTPTPGLNGAATVNVAAYTFSDAAGNTNSAASNILSVVVDTQPPTVSSFTASSATLKAGQTATLSIVLSEASSNFTVNDLQVVGGTLSSFSGSGSNYSVIFTPDANRTESGSVTVNRASFTDSAGNISVSGNADGVILDINTVRPTATLTARQSKLGVGDVTTIDITLSEKSTDFDVSDLSASHGTLSDFAPLGDGIHYSVVFTPTPSFTGIGGVTLADGKFTNAAGNGNGGATQPAQTGDLTIDTTPPTVTITSDKTALAIGQSAVITFTFNKDPGDSFDITDIVANGGTISNLVNHNGTVWTARFTPTDGSTGQSDISVAAGRYTDAAGNSGAAGVAPTIHIDTQGPVADLFPSNTTTVLPGKNLVLNFSESVVKGAGNIVLVDDTAGTRSSITVTDGMLTNGGKTLTITPASALIAGHQYHVEAAPGSLLDAAGNAWAGIASSTTWVGSDWHFTAATPSVSLNKISTDGRVNGKENTDGVVIDGVIESNTDGMVAAFVAGNFTVTLTPRSGGTTISAAASSYNTTTGAWSLTLPSNSMVDGKTYDVSVSVTGTVGAASGATASTAGSVLVDLSAAAPTLALANDTGASNSDGITRDGSINVSGLETGATWEYSTNNGTTWITGNGNRFEGASVDGTHTVLVRQTDVAGNTSSNASLTFTLDTAANRPVINAVATDNIINASETGSAITGTAEADASVQLVLGSGAQARTVTTVANGSGNWLYTLTSADLAALGSGQTQVTAVQTDKAGNESFATLRNLVVDTVTPTATITADKTALKAGETATLTFTLSEVSTTFSGADITVTGGTLSDFAGSGTSYTAKFTPTAGTTATASIQVGQGSFSDLAGNNNVQASESLALSVDMVRPTVAVASSATTLGPGEVATVTFTFSEASDSFSANSVSVAGGTMSALTANADRTVYTGVFTPSPTFFGSGSISVISGVVSDRAGNVNVDGSDANNTVALTIQAAPTTLVITSDKTALKGGETATLTFTFSSAPTGFAVGDIQVTGGTVGNFAGSGTSYTATLTPTANAASGAATVTVLDGSYTGQGGNPGTGARLDGIAIDTLAPTLLTLNPEDNGNLPASATQLVATFTEEVIAGRGNIRLVDSTTNTTQTYAIGSSAVVISGQTLTITPTTALVAGRNYYVSIDSTALRDVAGNAYAGIANATSWNFSATNLSTTINPVTGDSLVNSDEKAGTVLITGTISSVNPAVLSALQASDIVVTVTVPRESGTNRNDQKVVTCTNVTYDSTTGAWTAQIPTSWRYDKLLGSDYDVTTLINGDTDTAKVTVTGRSGTAAAGLSVTLTDTFTVDTSAPSAPTLTLAGDTGSSNSDEITRNGLINVGGLEAGASWKYSTDNGLTWQTGVGSSFSVTQDGATTLQVQQSDAAGNLSAVQSLAFTLDTTAIAPVINAVNGNNFINVSSETGSAITGTAEPGASVSLKIGSNFVRTLTANGTGVWSYTLQSTDITAVGQGAKVISVTQTDKAGNTSGAATVVVQVDTVQPTVTITADKTALKAGETAALTFTLSEVSFDFTQSDITVTGGTLSNFTGNGATYTATFTPNENSTTAASLQVASGSFSDAAGNTNSAASNTLPLTVSTVRPTVSVTSNVDASTKLYAGNTATLTFTLSESSSNFNAADITVVGGSLSNFSGSGASYTATFTPDANSRAPGSVSVASGSFTNGAGNANADGADANNIVNFAIATARPSLIISSDVSTLGIGQTALITFNFSDDPGTSFTLDDISIPSFLRNNESVPVGTLSAIQGSGTKYTAVFTPTTGFAGAAAITVADGKYTDSNGSLGTAGVSPALSIDALAPTVAITRSSSGMLAAGQTDTIIFDFSEAPGSSFTRDDIDVSGGTLGALSAVSATRYVAIFTPAVNASGTANIRISSGRFSDAAGNMNADGADADNLLSIDYNTGTGNSTSVTAPTLRLSADTGASGSDGITNNGVVEVSGLVAGATWEYSLNGGTNWLTGTGSSFILTAGSYVSGSVQARQALNSSISDPGSLASAVNYVPAYSGTLSMALETDSGKSGTDAITNQVVLRVSGLATTDTWRYSLDNGLNWTSGTTTDSVSKIAPVGVANTDQQYNILLEATDQAGNIGTSKYSVRWDAQAPVAPNISLTPDPNDGGAIVAATNIESGATLEYRLQLDSGAYSAWSSTYTAPTAAGTYTLQARQTDVAGNTGPVTELSFTTPAQATSLNLAAIAAGSGGFVINGQSAGDRSGYSVSSAGDVNGDGLADLIVGAYVATAPAGSVAGRTYVVFGKTTNAAIDLLDIAAGSGGFVINGQCANDLSGGSVSSAGDVNGDGLADLLVGASAATAPSGIGSGRSYVVFGKTSGTEINLSAVAAGSGGFVINGQCAGDQSGSSVSSAGDVNGDGLVDFIVGAPRSTPTAVTESTYTYTGGVTSAASSAPATAASTTGVYQGRSYLVFGKTSNSAVNLSAIAAGSGGFVINGQCAQDTSGYSVSGAGDVNGDGLADLIVGAQQSDPAAGSGAGRSYVVFGRTSSTAIDLSAIAAGSGGFVINGQCAADFSGVSVSSAGDVNGDGLADLIVGALFSSPDGRWTAGRSYVVFGKTSGTAVDLSAIAAGSGGFVIKGQCQGDVSGVSVSGAGDFNGDGLADLIISAPNSDPDTGRDAGRTYLVFGKTSGMAIDLSAIAAGSGGFVINGQCAEDQSGYSVSSAGDVNGDGLADLIVGALLSDPASGTNAGRSYVIFGNTAGIVGTGTLVDQLGTADNDTLKDDGVAKTLVAGAGDDSLTATAASVLYGGAGNDTFTIGQAMATALQSIFGAGGNISRLSRIDGGSGIDTLVLTAGTTLDLTKVAGTAAGDPEGSDRISSIECIDLSATGSALTLSSADIAQMVGTNSFNSSNGWSGLGASVARHQLLIKGAAGTLSLLGNWSDKGTATDANGVVYRVYNGDRNTQLLLADGRKLDVPPPPVDLSDIAAGLGGFVINGQCAGDKSGWSVSSAGDVNGDGLADLIVGAPYSSTGRSYVVFGKTTGMAINLSAIAASSGGSGGFVINGQCAFDFSGYSVSSAGDVNGDGLADLIVGAYASDPASVLNAGRSYVVFGKTQGLAVNLSDVAMGAGGFVINGQCANDSSGWSVSSAGDVNGDGLADLIVGAPNSSPASGSAAGRSYVVFGKTSGAAINLSAIAASSGGFVINGQCVADFSGWSVSSAGDVNGDGLADLIVGAKFSDPAGGINAGRSYVVFGKTSGTAINLSAIAASSGGAGGFVINGQCASDQSGYSVSSAGDVNGDGLADLIVGAYASTPASGSYAGRSYVVFGKTTVTAINLSAIAAGSGGFVINGQCASDLSGFSVSSAGDVNGDGLADLIVGAHGSSPAAGYVAGCSYVVFGKTTGAPIDLSAVAAGSGGFVINGQCASDYSGQSVSSAGDVNGDGLADLIVGAPYGSPASDYAAGRSYVIFGSTSNTFMPSTQVQMGTTGNDSLSDNGVAQLLVGGGGRDTLTATAASVLHGGNGSDTFIINQTMVTALQTPYGQAGNNGLFNASIDGGHGGINSVNGLPANYSLDTLQLSAANIALDLTKISNASTMNPIVNSRLSGIEIIDLGSATNLTTNSIKLTSKDVLDLSDAVDLVAVTGQSDTCQLVVRGPAGSTVDLADGTGITGWVKLTATVTGASWGATAETYDVWDSTTSRALLLVQTGILVV